MGGGQNDGGAGSGKTTRVTISIPKNFCILVLKLNKNRAMAKSTEKELLRFKFDDELLQQLEEVNHNFFFFFFFCTFADSFGVGCIRRSTCCFSHVIYLFFS
jgi:hypothetical protein